MKKFKVAFEGLYCALKHRSVLIQVILAILALGAGFILKLNYLEWLFFISAIFLVIALEIVNTCIERLCDFVEEHYNDKIKVIKDMSSAAVLLVAILALFIALIIFIHKMGG